MDEHGPSDAVHALSDGTRVMVQPEDGVLPLLELIGAAQRSIFIKQFTFTYPVLLDAVKAAHRAGRDVRVMLNPHRSSGDRANDASFAELQAAGVKMQWSSPDFAVTHEKSMVIDDAVTIIGSHNFDPRSDRYNTESGFIIFDRALAAAVKGAILHDAAAANAWTIARRPRTQPWGKINGAIADLSTALPLFDFWPFRYASSFELNSGCDPVPPSDPHFQECDSDVGDFPEVDLPMTTIYTRIVTAFGAGLLSIM